MKLMTDPNIYIPTGDGRYQPVTPYKLGVHPTVIRRDGYGARPMPPPPPAVTLTMLQQAQQAYPASMTPGAPISMQAQLKKLQPPSNVPHMRISSNGGMRPPVTPIATPTQTTAQQIQASPPLALAPSPVNGVNGINVPASPALNGLTRT